MKIRRHEVLTMLYNIASEWMHFRRWNLESEISDFVLPLYTCALLTSKLVSFVKMG